MESLIIRNWHFGPADEVQTYLVSVAAAIKLLELQSNFPVRAYTSEASNIIIDAVGSKKVLTASVSQLVNYWLGVDRSIDRISGIEIGIRDGKAPRSAHNIEATSYDYLLSRAIAISYRDKTKAITRKLFPDWHPTVTFLAEIRDALAHSGRKVRDSKHPAQWRGIDLGSLPVGTFIFPGYFSSGDLILLLSDVDEIIGSRWDHLSDNEKIAMIEDIGTAEGGNSQS